jgi:hypothetical protein
MTCPNLPDCPLSGQLSMKAALRVWQVFYCEHDYGRCARLRRMRAGEFVPLNLMPDGSSLVVAPPRVQ